MAQSETKDQARTTSSIISRLRDTAFRCASVLKVRALGTELPTSKAHLIFWICAVLGVLLDLSSKAVVFDWLEARPGRSVSVIDGFLQLVIAENSGAAFGIATGQRYLLIAISVIALAVILAAFIFTAAGQSLLPLAFGLFAAGVGGNLYDRLFNDGLVRDFIDVVYWPGRHWPTFNLADSMLCIAAGLLVLSSFTAKSSRKYVRQHK